MRPLTTLLLPFLVAARIHHLVLKKDPRSAFSIESFGFVKDGKVEIRVHDVSVSPAGNHTMGFLLFPSNNDAATSAVVEELIASKKCAVHTASKEVTPIDISDPATWCVPSPRHPSPCASSAMLVCALQGSHGKAA